MLKKSMKAVLTVAAIAGMTSAAMADAKVGGSVKAYVGQYNAGATTSTSYITGVSEGNVNFDATNGAMSAHMQIEGRNSSAPNDTQVSVSYMKDALSVTVGTIVTGVQYSIVSGSKTSALGTVGVYTGTNAYQEAHGLGVKFKVNDDIAVHGTIYGADVVVDLTGGSAGSATEFGFEGKFGDISAKANVVSSKADDHNGTTGESSSNQVISVKAGLGEGMSISVDSATEKQGTADPATDLAVQFKGANMGPGSVIATYATRDDKANLKKYTYMVGIYDVAVEKGAGIQAIYGSTATKPDSGSSTTATFVGVGFYSGF